MQIYLLKKISSEKLISVFGFYMYQDLKFVIMCIRVNFMVFFIECQFFLFILYPLNGPCNGEYSIF